MAEKSKWNPLGWLVFLGLLAAATYLAAHYAKLEHPESQLAVPPGTGLSTARDIELTGGLSQSTIETGKPARFWLTIRNRSEQTISEVSLEPSGLANFRITTECWKPQQGSVSCVPVQPPAKSPAPSMAQIPSSPARDVVIPQLARCQTLSVWGELSADTRQEKQMMFVNVRWVHPDKHVSQCVVPLGTLTAQDGFDKAKETWAAILGFYKDLGLPILLAVLAYLFKQWEDARERERQAAESYRRQLLQTWNKMLPVSHNDATKYYMPLAAAIRAANEDFKRCQEAMQKGALPANSPLVKESLYYFLLAMRRFRAISRQRGGFYFKDRTGEKISSLCVNEMFRLYRRSVAGLSQHTSTALSQMKPFTTFGEFIPVLEDALAANTPRTAVQEAFFQVHTGFYAWLSTAEFLQIVPLLKAFLRVLDFEMNQPYEYWYPKEQKERLKLEQDEKNTLTELAERAEAENDQYKTLSGELVEYFARSRGQQQQGGD